jgi:glycosyltransferase involved in cell wall biosynthesis
LLKDKTILYIVHNYNTFQKDPVEEVSKYFKKVYVLVRYKPISKIVKYLPFKSLKKYEDSYVVDLNNVPDNVEVIRTPVWYLPFGIFYKWAGYLHYKAVKRAIKKHNIEFDLVHCHFAWTAGYVGMRLKEIYKKPLVITAHRYDILDLPKISESFSKAIVKVLTISDKVITVSAANVVHLEKMGMKDIRFFPNGYSKEIFYFKDKISSRKKLALPLDKNIFLTIGNLQPYKGYEYLVKAINILHKENKRFLCLHIGAGPLEDSIKSLVNEKKVGDSIVFLGTIPHHKLVDYFGAADFFVSSSLSEGNPTVMFESLGCGKPFVGTKVGGVPEIINSNEYGLLCESKNAKALAENIQEALNRNWNTAKILKYGEQFSWENICINFKEIYEEVLA